MKSPIPQEQAGQVIAEMWRESEHAAELRRKVSPDELKTRYGKAWRKLLDYLRDTSDLVSDWYLGTLAETNFLTMEGDPAADQMEIKISQICDQECAPGRSREAWRKAVIITGDKSAFLDACYRRYKRCQDEAFLPYWYSKCRWWVDPKGNRRIFNDIVFCWWFAPGEIRGYSDGVWIYASGPNQGKPWSTNWSPVIPDTEQ